MKIPALISAFLLLAVSAIAQDKPPITVPTYPGAQVTMEMNMTNEDLQSLLPMFLPAMGDKLPGVTEEQVLDLLKDVKQVEYLQMEVNKKGVDSEKVCSYFRKKIPSGDWHKVYASKSANGDIMAVYSQSNAEHLYGFRVRTTKVDGKTVQQADVAKITGRIDFEKLIKTAGDFIMKSELEKQNKEPEKK